MVIFFTFFALMRFASYGLVVTVLRNSLLPIVRSVHHAKTVRGNTIVHEWSNLCIVVF